MRPQISMEKRRSWNDIPSLEGMEVDWEYKAPSPLGKRSAVRIQQNEISTLFAVREIFVKVATTHRTLTGRLLDISENGLSIDLPDLLAQGRPVNVGFFLGAMKITAKAVVVHAQKRETGYSTGLKFIDLNPKFSNFIGGLYAAKILHQIHHSG